FATDPHALNDGERQRCSRHVVGNIENDVSIDVAERVVERLNLPSEALDRFCRGRTTPRSALTGETLGSFNRVTRFHHILCHVPSPLARTRLRTRAASKRLGARSRTPVSVTIVWTRRYRSGWRPPTA